MIIAVSAIFARDRGRRLFFMSGQSTRMAAEYSFFTFSGRAGKCRFFLPDIIVTDQGATTLIRIPQNQAAYVPSAYPTTASRTPTGASAGWKAEATIGAEAAPPTLA